MQQTASTSILAWVLHACDAVSITLICSKWQFQKLLPDIPSRAAQSILWTLCVPTLRSQPAAARGRLGEQCLQFDANKRLMFKDIDRMLKAIHGSLGDERVELNKRAFSCPR